MPNLETTMGTLQDRFASGMTVDEMIEGVKANQELWRAIGRRSQAPAALVERLRSASRTPPRNV